MNKNENIQKRLFQILMVLLFLPMLQAKFEVVKIAPLGGYAEQPSDIDMKGDVWWNGVYQNNKEKFLKANFGFCNWAIRAEHQWAFSAFGMSRVNGLIIGKEDYLYEIAYINTRNGKDYLGDSTVEALAQKARRVQDTLRAMNKAFFFVLAPNKANYYPEYLPDELAKPAGDIPTNYTAFVQALNQKGVKHLDINEWFLSMKDTTSNPLYSRVGIHYSTYGAAITAKKIISEVEGQLGKDLPDLSWQNLYWSSDYKGSDDDLEKALNLASRITEDQLVYPAIEIKEEGKHKPRTIVIGDSYYWQLMQIGMSERIFDQAQFWYYNKEAYPGQRNLGDINMDQEIAQTEAVFIIMTSPNMKKFLAPFVDQLYNYFYDKSNMDVGYENKIKAKIAEIKSNPEWLQSVQQKATERNISLDDMIYMDAKYVVDQDL